MLTQFFTSLATEVMAAATLSSATPSQLCSSKSGLFRHSQPILVNPNSTRAIHFLGKRKGVMRVKCQATTVPRNKVPTMEERRFLNLLLLGALSVPTACMVIPYFAFLTPNSTGNTGSGIVAKDKLGNDIYLDQYLKTHKPGDRSLAQGFKGDPTYLIVENDGTLATYGLNAVCTHLGCVVPWNIAEKKFICPCHGSQYNPQGKVVRGPAPLSLALAHRDVDDGKVLFVPWVETDFRTGENPWWTS